MAAHGSIAARVCGDGRAPVFSTVTPTERSPTRRPETRSTITDSVSIARPEEVLDDRTAMVPCLTVAVFRPEDCNRLDFEILAEGGVALYYQHEILGEDIAWFALEGYEVIQFDEEALDSIDGFHFEARLKLGFDESYEPTFDNLRESMSELEVPQSKGGMALVLPGAHRIAQDDRAGFAGLLGVISNLSHEFMLTGQRFLALVQSDDGEIQVDSVGPRSILWNPRERMAWTRGL